MKLISHRGNVNGREPFNENHPNYLLEAISLGFEIEADFWCVSGQLFLGHDKPQYKINKEFLLNDKIWCHAKNIEALELLLKMGVHCFWHQTDDYTITSRGVIWAYPGKKLNNSAICVMPELHHGNQHVFNCAGICSDFIQKYRKEND